MIHKKYIVDDGAAFDIVSYPEIAEELKACRERLGNEVCPVGADMVISYNRHHKLRKVWVDEHGDFAERLLIFFGKNTYTASLFAATGSNSLFLGSLETYVKQQFL